MSVLDPVTPFLTLIDRIISLIKTHRTSRREYFEKIIDPLYSQFKPLAENYLRLFHEAQKAVKSQKRAKRRSTVARIKAKRDEFAIARMQLRGLLHVCEENSKKRRDDDLTEFVKAMSRFFVPKGCYEARSYSWLLVDVFEGLGARNIEPVRAWELIYHANSYLEMAWYELAGRYMELKLRYLDQ